MSPRLSIFTPCHNSDYLVETWQSIKRQTYSNVEWVIVPNKSAVIPAAIAQDPMTRIVDGARSFDKVGELKRFACEHTTGDVLIELDADDVLTPGTALSSIAEAHQRGGQFIYSDAAVFKNHNFAAHAWSKSYGWTSYPVTVYGRSLLACRTFDITPRTLSEIYTCPDHVRCWDRSAYFRTGGHDTSLSVCDDHDLMCRSYLAGLQFEHTGGCHYLYRLHVANTIHSRATLIKDLTIATKRKYLSSMIQEWVKRHNLKTLDLSQWVREGWTFERNLADGFGVNRFGAITADCLEFCPAALIPDLMNAFHDALLPGGYLTARVPDSSSNAGDMDPRTKTRFNQASFLFYTHKEYAAKLPGVKCRFQQVAIYNDTKLSKLEKQFDLKYLLVHLCALKGQTQPGGVFI